MEKRTTSSGGALCRRRQWRRNRRRAGATPSSAPRSGPASAPGGGSLLPALRGFSCAVTAHAYERESDITCGIRPKIIAVRYHLEPWLSEADTRAKLIDPAIHFCGWTEDLICRETTLGAVEIIAGKARRRSGGRTDYTLRVRVSAESQPVALALLEAKKDTLPPGHGLDQAKGYLRASQHNVQFVFSSNGYRATRGAL